MPFGIGTIILTTLERDAKNGLKCVNLKINYGFKLDGLKRIIYESRS